MDKYTTILGKTHYLFGEAGIFPLISTEQEASVLRKCCSGQRGH